jgi:hypothetical protein
LSGALDGGGYLPRTECGMDMHIVVLRVIHATARQRVVTRGMFPCDIDRPLSLSPATASRSAAAMALVMLRHAMSSGDMR